MNIHTKIKTLTIILISTFIYPQVFNTTSGTQYSTITDALQDASASDLIQVSEGIYAESFTIDIPITLEGDANAVIDASNESNAISIMGNDVIVRGFEIIGSDATTSGIAVNPGSQNITIQNNTIHGMGFSNPSNESPLSYGIVVWGNESPPNPPINVTIDGNEIYDISGTGISLGEITQNITITNNIIRDINPLVLSENIIPDQDLTSIGINGLFADNVLISGNTFSNLTVGITLGISTGAIGSNAYSGTSIFFASLFFNTESDDGFTFTETENYWRSEQEVQSIVIMHAYCSTLDIAKQTADDGSTIISSNGEEINQDCDSIWGGNNLPFCGSCQATILGDVTSDGFANVLDVVQIINYVLGLSSFTDTQECLSDVNEDANINILDIVTLVQSIIG